MKIIKLSDEEKPQELQKYLNIWKTENGIFEQEMNQIVKNTK